MNHLQRYVKCEAGSKKSIDNWKVFRPDSNDMFDWCGRTFEDACAGGTNVAFMTGWGIYVIDVDTKNGDGLANWEQKRTQFNLPDTFSVKTPSGGFHFYFRVPEDAGLRNSAFWGEHIDCRADGGYVLYPPSKLEYVGANGEVEYRPYEIISNIAMAPLPETVLYALKEHRRDYHATIASLGVTFDNSDNIILAGSRDDTLIRLAGRLVNILPFPSVEAISILLRETYFGHCENPSQDGWMRFVFKLPSKVNAWIDSRKRRLDEQKLSRAIGSTVLDLHALTQDYLSSNIIPRRFPIGITEFDAASNGGPKAGDLGLVVARTKVGKTATLLSFVYNWARQGFKVLFIEMEMLPEELTHRIMARHTGISFWEFEQNRASAKDALRANYQSYQDICSNINFVCEPVAQIDACIVEDIIARQEYLTGKHFDIVCIDYAGQLNGKGDSYFEKSNSVAMALRSISLTTKKFVLSAVQANRDKDGKDLFATIAGGDGLARAATWELFLDPQMEREILRDENGNTKLDSQKNARTIKTNKVLHQDCIAAGSAQTAVILRVTLRGRSILTKELDLPFAHAVCAFADVFTNEADKSGFVKFGEV